MVFWRDLVLPIVIVAICVAAIVLVINLVLRTFKLDITIFRIIAFFAIWYFVGPIVYNWLSNNVLSVHYEGIKILYMPIQYIIEYLSKLV